MEQNHVLFRFSGLHAALLLLILPVAAPAQDRDKAEFPPPTLTAIRILAPPVIDGRLDEDFWAEAPETLPFLEHRSAEAVAFRATARVAYDESALYVAARLEETEPASLQALPRKDDLRGIFADDGVEIFIDPQATRARFNQFVINAAGYHAVCSNGDFAAPLIVDASTSIGADAWLLEARIPFSNFGQPPALGDRWGLNFSHHRSGDRVKKGYHAAWSPTYGGLQKPGRFGYVIFGGAPGQPLPLDPPDARVTRDILRQIEKEAQGKTLWGPEDLTYEERNLRAVRLMELNPLLARFPAEAIPYIHPAISDTQPLPWTVPPLELINQTMRVSACRGEYEPAALGVFALREMKNVLLEASDLVSAEGRTLPSGVADIFHLKCWYQAGAGDNHVGKTALIPELLLKNSGLIRVDARARRNVLLFDGLPRDSEALQPVDVPAYHTQQYWITFNIPADAAAGVYEGKLTVTAEGREKAGVPVQLTVHDFDLAPSRMIHSLYYTLRLPSAKEGEAVVRPVLERMREEIRNQVEHGINSPSTYVSGGALPWDDDPLAALQAVVDAQREAGVKDGPLICVTAVVGRQEDEATLRKFRAQAERMAQFARMNGRGPFFFQGMDEAKADVLAKELKAFKAVNEGGSQVFVACGLDYWDVVGKWLNMPVLAGPPVPEFAKMVHENAPGTRLLSYYNPQTGIERPEVYRRNYGLKLWAAGYDGAMDWQYQGDADSLDAWDDFNSNHIRDETMAYPALGRPVDTIQWEGWREGVDDVRYVGTLLDYLEELEARPVIPAEAHEAREWLNRMSGDEDLDELRQKIVGQIRILSTIE